MGHDDLPNGPIAYGNLKDEGNPRSTVPTALSFRIFRGASQPCFLRFLIWGSDTLQYH